MSDFRRRRSLLQRSMVLDSSNLGGKVVRGAGFQFLGITLRTLLTIGSTAVLARLLTPADFGYVAMATVVTELVALFSNFGFANLLIQRHRITRLQVDTVFWSSAGVGLLLAAAVFTASHFAGWLFGDPIVREVLQISCISFAFSGLPSIAWVVLARLMRFRTEFWMQIAAVLVRTVVAVCCAWGGLGVWSLVIGGVVGSALQAALAFVAVPYRPRLRFHKSFLSSSWRTSGSYLGGGLLYYTNMNIDLALIGRYLGAAPLGLYQNARSLTDEIRGRIAIPIQHVLFPALAALQHEPERHRELVLRAGRMLSAVVVPIGFGVSANAVDLVLVLYGPRWTAMTPLMTLFGISAALRASTAIASPLFNAANRVGQALRYNIAGTVLTVVAVAMALPHGIDAVGLALAGSTLYTLLVLYAAFRIVGLAGSHVATMIGLPVLASCMMWGAIHLLRPFTTQFTPLPAVTLAIHVAIGGAVYLLLLHTLSRQFAADARQMFAALVHKRNR